MENLKITFSLDSPLLINRFSTIDSLLVNLYVKRHFGKNIEVEKLYDFDFIEKYKDGYCGSIWFVEKGDHVMLENRCIVKKPEYEYLNENRSNKVEYNMGGGEFKAYNIWFEALIAPRVYFYVRGKKDIIEDLLNDLKFLGKKSALGLGHISSFKVETVDQDKSVFLNENTPSRPVSVKNHSIKNSRIAYYGCKVPYWANWLKEACYMPNSSLVETLYEGDGSCSTSIDESYLKEYHSAINFVYDALHKDVANWQEISLADKALRNDQIIDSEPYLCAFSGEKSSEGILCKSIEKTLGSTFTDYAHLNGSKFVSKQTLWTIQCGVNSRVGKRSLGFHVIDKNGIVYVMGKNKTKSIEQAIDEAALPFNIALKTTPNNQHVVFKSNLTLSKDLIACFYGENYYFGFDEAKKCLERVKEIVAKYPVTKSHLIPSPQISAPFPKFRKEVEAGEAWDVVSDFYKQFNKDVRVGAFILTIGGE